MIKKSRIDALIENPDLRKAFLYGHGKGRLESERRKRNFIYAAGYYDFEFFFDYFFEHLKINPDTGAITESASFHPELFAEMNIGWLLAIIARGHAKTTRGWVRWIWKVCYFKEVKETEFLLWTSDNLVKTIIAKIRTEFEENKRLRDIYGTLVPIEEERKENKLKTYTQKKIDFLNGCKIQGISKFASVRGMRPDEIWVDDPQENKEVENEAIAKKFLNHLKTSLIPTLKPGGSMNITGTNLGKYCLVNLLAEDPTNNFRLIEYKAIPDLKIGYEDVYVDGEIRGKRPIIEEGTPIWEARYSIKDLEILLQNMGEEEFLQEFQNVPMILNMRPVFGKNLLFKIKKPTGIIDDWVFYVPLKNGRPAPRSNCLIGIDPDGSQAGDGSTGDNSSVHVYSRSGELIAERHGRIDQALLAGEINNLFTMGIRGLIIPERNIGLALIKALQNFPLLKNSIYMQINADKTGKRELGRTLGFHTNQTTRGKMIGETRFFLRYTSEKLKGLEVEAYEALSPIELEVSEATVDEINHFYVNDKQKAEALPGHHDDRVLSLMLTLQGLHVAYIPEELPDLSQLGL